MNPVDPLEQLQPLRAPLEIGWWPLAPGWWLLLALLLLVLAGLGWYMWRHWQAAAYRRHALKRLRQLSPEDTEFPQQVNALLKAVALRSFGNARVAALHGESWLRFLESSRGRGQPPFPGEFAHAPYSQTSGKPWGPELHAAAQNWVKHHRAVA